MSQTPIVPIQAEILSDKSKIIVQSAGFSLAKTALFTATLASKVGNDIALNNLSPSYFSAPFDDSRFSGVLKGPFNVPIFDLVTLKGTFFTDPQGKNWVLDDLDLLTCLIEIKQERHIVKTPVQGRNGTIKEYISDDDYYITINGLLSSNYTDIFPQQQMQFLMQFCQFPGPNFAINSPLLNNYFGIQNVIVNNYYFNQIEGDRSNIAFTLDLISDPSYEIKLKYT